MLYFISYVIMQLYICQHEIFELLKKKKKKIKISRFCLMKNVLLLMNENSTNITCSPDPKAKKKKNWKELFTGFSDEKIGFLKW